MNTTTNYTEQAENLLVSMGIKFSAKFIKHGRHFEGETQTRDIFLVQFTRNGKSFTIKFGQSIKDSTGNGRNKPTAYDVLACLQKYEVGSFSNFCGDFGYDKFEKSSKKIYNLVCKEWEKVDSFFTSEEIEQLQEIN